MEELQQTIDPKDDYLTGISFFKKVSKQNWKCIMPTKFVICLFSFLLFLYILVEHWNQQMLDNRAANLVWVKKPLHKKLEKSQKSEHLNEIKTQFCQFCHQCFFVKFVARAKRQIHMILEDRFLSARLMLQIEINTNSVQLA